MIRLLFFAKKAGIMSKKRKEFSIKKQKLFRKTHSFVEIRFITMDKNKLTKEKGMSFTKTMNKIWFSKEIAPIQVMKNTMHI